MFEPTAALFGTLGVNRGVVLFGPDNQTNQMYVSRDSGLTWKAFGGISASSYSANPVIQVIDAERTAFHSGLEWMEYDRIADSIVASPVPDTIRYVANSADQMIAIASRSYLDDRARTSRLFVSLNGRASWSSVGEIRFENADTVLSSSTGGKQVFEASSVVQHGANIALILQSGMVVTLDRDGRFWFRGTLARTSGNNVYRYANVIGDGSLRFVDCGRIYDLPADVTLPIVQRTDDMRMVGQITIKDSVIIAGSFNMLYRSTDFGLSFTPIKAPEDLVDISAIPGYGFRDLHMNRLCITSDSTVVYAAEKGPMIAEYNTKTGSSRVLRISESLLRQRDAESDGKFSIYNHHLENAGSDRIGLTAAAFPSWLTYDTTRRSVRIAPASDFPARFQQEDGQGFVLYQGDSIHVSIDSGRTWITSLPFTTTISSLCKRSDGVLVAGARGYREISGEDTVVHIGGVWRSADLGATWVRAAGIDTLQTVTYIYNSGSIVLATSIDAMWNRDLDAYSQNNAYIWRSTDGGSSWVTVLHEARFRSAHTGRRKIVRHPNGWYFAVSVESGVVVSKDDGVTWSQYGSYELRSRFITDIDVHQEMGVCVVTDKGLFHAPVQLTDVDVETPTGKGVFLTVWAYPTPATEKLRIRINNGQLANYRFGALRLFDLNGSVVEDLTRALESTPRSDRMEFDVDVAHIPYGIYLIGLDTGAGFKGAKVVLIDR